MGKVRVLLFAQMASAAGVRCLEWEVSAPQHSDAFWSWLLARHPGLGDWRAVSRLARNGEYMVAGDAIQAGDELAVIPPVSGG